MLLLSSKPRPTETAYPQHKRGQGGPTRLAPCCPAAGLRRRAGDIVPSPPRLPKTGHSRGAGWSQSRKQSLKPQFLHIAKQPRDFTGI